MTLVVPGEAAFSSSERDTSFTGGGQLGCNWQLDPNWVVGVEGDFNYLRSPAKFQALPSVAKTL